MTVDQNTSKRRPAAATLGAPAAPRTEPKPALESPVLQSAVRPLREDAARFVAVAPTSLDVMGGLSDYTGALSLSFPTDDHVCAAVQRRQDGKLEILLADGSSSFAAPIDGLVTGDPETQSFNGNGRAHAEPPVAIRAVTAILSEAARAGVLPPFNKGLSVSIAMEPGFRNDVGTLHALFAAVLTAAGGALDCTVNVLDALTPCNRAAANWLGLPPASADALLSFSGGAGALNQLRMDTGENTGVAPLPSGLCWVGVDCGFTRDDLAERNADVRVTTFMGRHLIDRIIRHSGCPHISWDGLLSRLSISEFTTRFRERLPTTLCGQEYLDRFGETDDPFTQIDPTLMYKIRSRTEHHVYEHDRSRQLVECLARASRVADGASLQSEAFKILKASHWSYGQRCGLGSFESDALVALIRGHGTDAGVYGAKVSGRGCGGVVVVLMESSDTAEAALERALHEYAAQTGRTPRILRGSRPGAQISGPRAM